MDDKNKRQDEGNQLYDKIVRLKMTARNGKSRFTDVAQDSRAFAYDSINT